MATRLPDIDPARIHFFGWSLGGIIGSAYMGTPLAVANVKSVSLFAAGCGIMETLRQSPGYSPVLNNGLAAAGFPPGTSIYWEFVHAAQAAVESGDGCNYAANWIAKPTLMQMIQGTAGNATRPTDQAVPNSSTLRLANLLGLPTITATLASGTGARGLTRFTEGGHGTIALPSPAPQTRCVLPRSPQRASLVPGLRRRCRSESPTRRYSRRNKSRGSFRYVAGRPSGRPFFRPFFFD